MRAAVYFDPPDEGRVGLVHDNITRSNFLQYMLVHVAIVWMHNGQVVHVVQFIEVFHIFEIVNHDLLLLRLLNLCRLDFIE